MVKSYRVFLFSLLWSWGHLFTVAGFWVSPMCYWVTPTFLSLLCLFCGRYTDPCVCSLTLLYQDGWEVGSRHRGQRCAAADLVRALSVFIHMSERGLWGKFSYSTICPFRWVTFGINSKQVGKDEAKMVFFCIHISSSSWSDGSSVEGIIVRSW